MLDEASAAAEAMLTGTSCIWQSNQTFSSSTPTRSHRARAVLETRAEPIGVTLKFVDFAAGDAAGAVKDGVFGALIQNPGSSGRVRDISADIAAVKGVGGVAVRCQRSPCSESARLARIRKAQKSSSGSSQRFSVFPFVSADLTRRSLRLPEGLERQMCRAVRSVSRADADGRPALPAALCRLANSTFVATRRPLNILYGASTPQPVLAAMYAVLSRARPGLRQIAINVFGKSGIGSLVAPPPPVTTSSTPISGFTASGSKLPRARQKGTTTAAARASRVLLLPRRGR